MRVATKTRNVALALFLLGAVAACSGAQRAMPDAASRSTPSRNTPATGVTIREFADLPRYSGGFIPSGIASGPKRSLWVTDTIDSDFGPNAVVQIATSGKELHVFHPGTSSTSDAVLVNIVEGPDLALWITDVQNEQILRMTTAGVFSSYKVGASPVGITVGPDRALWFTEASAIGRMTTSGTVSTFSGGSGNESITTGSDGNLWFTESTGNAIGRISTKGKLKEYTAGISGNAGLWGIAAGSDGALWFTESKAGRIGRITTSGKVSEYSSGISPGEQPWGIAPGPDGALWFCEYKTPRSYRYSASKIGRITTNGEISEYHNGLTGRAAPKNIVQGPDKKMWFVEMRIDKTGRATP